MLLGLLAVILVVLLVSYLVTHFYFMFKDPDALRSEKFKIQKMQIERGLIGDDTGMRQALTGPAARQSLSMDREDDQQ